MILVTILIVISAIANAIMDKISFHHSTSIFKDWSNWWNPKESWKYKWKNGNKAEGEKFWLSSTWLVWTTDAWHLMKSIMEMCLLVAIVIYTPYFNPIIDLGILFLVQAVTFHTFFTYILNKTNFTIKL